MVFLGLLGLIYFFDHNNPEMYDTKALIIGDVGLALLSIFSFMMVNNALKNKNPNAFIRAKMGGTILRLFVCVIGIVGYVYLKEKVPMVKPTIFMLLGMYMIYTILEAVVLSKKSRVGA